MKKNTYWVLVALVMLVCAACTKEDAVVRNEDSILRDMFANLEGAGSDRMFEPTITDNTIYFEIPYYYPVDSDYETDLSRIVLRATIPSDATVSPQLGQPMDLRQPLTVTITAGNGETTAYTVIAKRVGDVSMSGVKISYVDLDNVTQEIEGIRIGDEFRFFILPGTDVSNATLNYTINRHAQASIGNGAQLDLSTPTPITVTAQGDAEKTYQLVVTEPVRLDEGFGINRQLWFKNAADLGGLNAVSENALAVSGDNMVMATIASGGNSRYRVYNRFTGAYIQDLQMPYSDASGQYSLSGQIVSDSKGNILAINRASVGQTIRIYKYNVDNLMGTPTKLIETTHNQAGSIAGDRSIGRRLNVYGDVEGDAVITSTLAATFGFYRWTITGGVVDNPVPELVVMGNPVSSSNLGWQPEAQPLSTDPSANYVVAYQHDFAYVNGTTNNRMHTIALSGNRFFQNAMTTAEFNNAKYLALRRYPWNLNNSQFELFDITNAARLGTPASDPSYPLFRVFTSPLITNTSGTDSGGTGDIAVGYSDNGDRMQVYLLQPGGGILAHEFTVYSAE